MMQRMLAEKKSMHGAADVDRQTMHQHQAQANFFFSSATQARSIGMHRSLPVKALRFCTLPHSGSRAPAWQM